MLDVLVVIQVVTVLMGSCTVLLSAYLSYVFYRVKHDLSFSVALVLFAQFVTGIITVFLSVNAVAPVIAGSSPLFSPIWAMGFRGILFITVGITSMHLLKTLNNIVERGDDDFWKGG